jgi:hypothetical protein
MIWPEDLSQDGTQAVSEGDLGRPVYVLSHQEFPPQVKFKSVIAANDPAVH